MFTTIKVAIGGYLCRGILYAHLWITFHEELKMQDVFRMFQSSRCVLFALCEFLLQELSAVVHPWNLNFPSTFSVITLPINLSITPWTTLSLNSSASTRWNSHPSFNLLAPQYVLSSIFMAWHTQAEFNGDKCASWE